MLKWIVGGKADHPLADIKEARVLIAELPANDAIKALEDITGWLESLVNAEGFKLDRLYELIDLLDGAAQARHRKLVYDYLAMSRQQKFQENKLWSTGSNFAKAVSDAYLSFLKRYEEGASGVAAVKKQAPVACARALRALATRVKWTMVRYGPFEARLWSSVAYAYNCAERLQFDEVPLTVYPGLHGNASVRQEYLKVLMLWASSADVLPPLKQDVTERAVAHYSSFFQFAKELSPGALYAFDPAHDRPPVRLFGNTKVAPNAHYFGPGDASAKLAEVIPVLDKTGVLPANLNLGRNYPTETVLAVFKHLAMYWSDKPPARLSERRATTARITVVPGYVPLLDELEREESDALNFTESAAESWIVEDASDNGYGALVPATATDWVRVGELIGVQVEGSAGWGVAIIRRVVRDEQRQYHVGMQMLSRAVSAVRLSRGVGAELEHAVLLSTKPDSNGEVAIIRRAGRYDSKNTVELAVRDKIYELSPRRLIDAGDDFDWGSYKVGRLS